MKYLITACAFLTLSLAACDGGQESADDAANTASGQSVESETAADTSAAQDAKQAADEGAGETQVVEESATVDEVEKEDHSIQLAQAKSTVPAGDWKYTEGKEFQRLVPTQPTVGGADKIEVAEIFWYGCPHCRDFEPMINRWAENAPANVRFVRIPAVWNPLVKLHAQLYYAEQVLVENGKIADPEKFHAAIFSEYHDRHNRMASKDAIQAVFERLGVSAEDFEAAWNSFEVAQKLRVAEDLTRRYDISGVPTIVVNGKYRTGAAAAGSYPQLIEVIDELVQREMVR